MGLLVLAETWEALLSRRAHAHVGKKKSDDHIFVGCLRSLTILRKL